mmetsp:Transcript_37647/g.42666  ORF Transcript_37647/g.42666 Transcript_37647/m.42666 type:complete len:222 (+) Transcript_37647:299-964(+)
MIPNPKVSTLNSSLETPSWETWKSRRSHSKYMTLTSSEKYPVLYKCTLCGTSLTREYSLRLHVMSHFKVKRYECDVCHKRYSSKQYLQEHKLVHSQTSLLGCPDQSCGRRFRRHARLVYHCRVTGHGQPDSLERKLEEQDIRQEGVEIEEDEDLHLVDEYRATVNHHVKQKEVIFKVITPEEFGPDEHHQSDLSVIDKLIEAFKIDAFLRQPLLKPNQLFC